MLTSTTLGAIAIAATGNLTVLAAAASETSGLAPWVQGGGSAAAVAGLVYVARMIVRGELVPRPVRDTENEMKAEIMIQGQREAQAMKIAEESVKELRLSREQHDKGLLILDAAARSMKDVAEEMEYWREMRDRGTKREDRGPAHREGR